MAPDQAADRMIAAAEQYGRRLMVYQPERGGREVVCLQSILAQGLIGDVYLIKQRYGSGEKLPWQEATFDLKDVEAVDTYARAYSYFTGVGEPFVPLTESREFMRVLAACRADADNVK